jgi:hypothetical protein
MDTTYKTVNAFLVAAIPEFRLRYEEEMERRGRHPPQYIAFSALVSAIVSALDFEANPGFLANVFDALEKMALSPDLEVVHLLQVKFVEDLVKHPKRLAKAWVLMGRQRESLQPIRPRHGVAK